MGSFCLLVFAQDAEWFRSLGFLSERYEGTLSTYLMMQHWVTSRICIILCTPAEEIESRASDTCLRLKMHGCTHEVSRCEETTF